MSKKSIKSTRAGIKLKELRELRKESQEDLAKLLGIPQRKLSRYENGQPIPDDDKAKFAEYFGCSISEFYDVGRPPSQNPVIDDRALAQAVMDLTEIFRNGDAETQEAISINLRTFVKKIRSERRTKELESKMAEMRAMMEQNQTDIKNLQDRLNHIQSLNNPSAPDATTKETGTDT